MKIFYTKQFKKHFKSIPQKIQNKFFDRVNIFIQNRSDPILKIHPLKGNLVGFRAFSVTGDYRVTYKIISKNEVKLIDIGTHNQVYK